MAKVSGSRQVVTADGGFAGLFAAANTPGHAGRRHGPHTCASRLVALGRRLELAPSSGRRGHAQGRLGDTSKR